MTITINLSPELERDLRETSAAKGVPAEEFVVGALSATLRQSQSANPPPQIPPAEARLLAVINEGLTEGEWQRYRFLKDKRRAGTLTPEEDRESMATTMRLEQMAVTRLEKLIELARLRGVTLDEVMQQLDIRRPEFE
jgi:hypothetical protein